MPTKPTEPITSVFAMRSPEGVTIRPTVASDVPALVDLMEAVAGEGRYIGRELPVDRDAQRQRFIDGIADQQTHSLVATRDDQVVGSLGLVASDHGHAELGMMLAPDVRGGGMGTALLDDALGWAHSRSDVHKVTLQVWPHNTAALALYRRAGFVVEGYRHRHWRRRNGELWDVILMGLLVQMT